MIRRLTASAGMLLLPLIALAQSTGTLSGKVTGPDGEPSIGAVVRVGTTRQGASTRAPDGTFTVAGIQPGNYAVTISALGFRTVSQQVTIVAGQVVSLRIRLEVNPDADTVVIRAPMFVSGNPGSSHVIDGDELTIQPNPGILAAVGRSASASTTGVNGVSMRGGRPTETGYMVDGVLINERFVGGLGNTAAGLFPMMSSLAVANINVSASGFTADQGNTFAGNFNVSSRVGDPRRYEGAFNVRTAFTPFYGSSEPITVKKAGTDLDTTLPGAKLASSGNTLYEFAFGGPVPGVSGITFFLSGLYNHRGHTDASYNVYDMSPEYAAARASIARELWGTALEPMNLGQLAHQESMVRNMNARFRIGLSQSSHLDLGGEVGLTSRELGDWNHAYMYDHPTFYDTAANGTVTTRVDNSILERDQQQIDQNTIINRFSARYFQMLDTATFFDVLASYVTNEYEVGKKDESKSYGIFDAYDIHPIEDNNNDRIIDRYDSPTGDVVIGGQRTNVQLRNPITGLYEGGESNGASHDPFGVFYNSANGLGFPVHGNDRDLDFRNSRTITLKGSYETNIELGEVRTQLKTGFDFATYELRRHYNSLAWVKQPFFDVYGYDAPYFDETKPSEKAVKDFLAEPYTPMEGGLYVQGRFDYKSIVFQPGVRFDFVQPNSKKSPLQRSTVDQVARGLDAAEDATLKFQVSPRVGVSYPVTETSQFRVNFAMMFKMPDFNLLFDNAYGSAARGNQVFGNPNIEPQKVFMYEMGYEAQLAEDYSIDVLAYYRDIFNQSGLTFISAIPSPYLVYTVQEYGNVRGLELTLRRQLVDNITGSVNYSLQRAVGTASNPGANYAQLIAGADPYTGEQRTVPLTEYPLSYDQTHSLKGTVSLVWQDDEGPSIGGMKLLENTDITFTATYGTGLPYTRFNNRGEQIGEYNAERQPSAVGSEMHIERGFRLADIFGESVGNLELGLFADITNVLNLTGPLAVYGTSGNSDNNLTSMNRLIGDFTAQPHYRDMVEGRTETFASNQYDRYGQRLYNPYADTNLDGVVTQSERYEGYQRYIATVQTLQGNYQRPRTVAVGVKLRF